MDRSMEMNFLGLFAGLEELVLDFRRRNNLEYVLTDDWPLLRKQLRSFIKLWKNKNDTPLSKDQRRWLYGNLQGLNRVAIEVAFTKFCEHYRLDLSDLWPVFQLGDAVGLADIRNRIVHGERLPEVALDALLVATQSLEWILERMLLGILGWPVERSEVSPAFLQQHATAIAAMPDARSRLLEILSPNQVYAGSDNLS